MMNNDGELFIIDFDCAESNLYHDDSRYRTDKTEMLSSLGWEWPNTDDSDSDETDPEDG